MGRDCVEVIRVTATVSRHNSEQDRLDDARVAELRARLVEIASEYDDIGVTW